MPPFPSNCSNQSCSDSSEERSRALTKRSPVRSSWPRGVLFLDEITELTPSAQAKVLRVLQEREFRRLGGTRPIKANVRVIAATNRDLYAAVGRGLFRADLSYRVNVFEIRIPPLRERRDDIILLAETFLQEFAQARHQHTIKLTPDATDVLLAHAWPGNVRELRNVLERATIVCEGGRIHVKDLSLLPRPVLIPWTAPSSTSWSDTRYSE